jgi:uncharacterized glyoxalase superfamily protein PhnB
MTTTTKQVLHPTLRYRDAHAAIDWLERALGFERRTVHTDDDGNVVHAELDFRGGLVMLGSARNPTEGGFQEIAPPPGSSSVYVVIDDPDALHDRAVAAGGGEIVRELVDLDYGSRDFAVRDPEGNLWNFGTYDPWAAG